MKIAIIGAGPAGLTAAYQLSKNKDVVLDVYEAGTSVGGSSKTIDLWGYKVDLGPHRFFSTDQRVNKLWLEIAGEDYTMVNRLTRIYYKDRYFDYPLSLFNALSNIGIKEAIHSVASYAKGRMIPIQEKGDFESWVSRRFGKRLYEIFFKSYSEKLWGIPCSELDSDFAAQRIKKLSLFEAVKNVFLGNRNGKHKTLVEQFAYPTHGTGMIYNRMTDRIESAGANIHFQSKVNRVITKNGEAKGLLLEDGTTHHYDHVVSTMPLTKLVGRMQDIPHQIKRSASHLSFRNTILVYLLIDGKNLFPDNWLYIHSDKLKMGRITNFRNWSPQLYREQEGTVVSVEYWCNDDDAIWIAPHSEIIDLAKKELRKTGLIQNQEIKTGKVYSLPNCYPVYQKGYKAILKPVEEALSAIKGLSVIGRYGSFKYNNQDHSILMGILAAENILTGTNHNLWEVNTDYENYQEKSTITKSGLVLHND